MMRHANWLIVDRATAEFFDRTLRNTAVGAR
jgi:hypothetical protein